MMKYLLLGLAPLALAACQTTSLPDLSRAPSVEESLTSETTDDVAVEDAVSEVTEEIETVEADPIEDAPVVKQTLSEPYVDISPSPLVQSLVSPDLQADDIALMGIVNGARTYCGLDWQPSFVTFVNIANKQGLDVSIVADDHGFYMGSARTALENAEYECSEQDLIDLRAIDPY